MTENLSERLLLQEMRELSKRMKDLQGDLLAQKGLQFSTEEQDRLLESKKRLHSALADAVVYLKRIRQEVGHIQSVRELGIQLHFADAEPHALSEIGVVIEEAEDAMLFASENLIGER